MDNVGSKDMYPKKVKKYEMCTYDEKQGCVDSKMCQTDRHQDNLHCSTLECAKVKEWWSIIL